MSALARQLSAAQRQYDSMSAPEPMDEREVEQAVAMVEARMLKQFEVGELIADLYDSGYAYGALDRLLSNTDAKRLMPGDADALQTLLRVVKSVNDSVERELEKTP